VLSSTSVEGIELSSHFPSENFLILADTEVSIVNSVGRIVKPSGHRFTAIMHDSAATQLYFQALE
jgi:hypothetical protein